LPRFTDILVHQFTGSKAYERKMCTPPSVLNGLITSYLFAGGNVYWRSFGKPAHITYPRNSTSRLGSKGWLLSGFVIVTNALVEDGFPRACRGCVFAFGSTLSTWLWFKHKT